MSWVVPRCWTSGRSRFDANLESQTDLGTRQAARAMCNWNFASSCIEVLRLTLRMDEILL